MFTRGDLPQHGNIDSKVADRQRPRHGKKPGRRNGNGYHAILHVGLSYLPQ